MSAIRDFLSLNPLVVKFCICATVGSDLCTSMCSANLLTSLSQNGHACFLSWTFIFRFDKGSLTLSLFIPAKHMQELNTVHNLQVMLRQS